MLRTFDSILDSAQTPKETFVIVPLRTVIGNVLETGTGPPIFTPVVVPPPVKVNPFRSRMTAPGRFTGIVIAVCPAGQVKFPLKTYVPGAGTVYGNFEILMVEDTATDCADAKALIVRTSAAIKNRFLEIIFLDLGFWGSGSL